MSRVIRVWRFCAIMDLVMRSVDMQVIRNLARLVHNPRRAPHLVHNTRRDRMCNRLRMYSRDRNRRT